MQQIESSLQVEGVLEIDVINMIKQIQNWLSKSLGSDSSINPYYRKLVGVPMFKEKASPFDRIYFIGGFEYNEISYSKFRDALQVGNVGKFLSETRYNAQRDNIELYLVEKQSSEFALLVLLDPLELLRGEHILDYIDSPKIAIKDFKSELIYPTDVARL